MLPRSYPFIKRLYSKSEKNKRPFTSSSSSSSSHSCRHVIFFSLFCLLVGISGTIFSLIYLSGHRSDDLFRRGQVQDAFRGEYLAAKIGGGDQTKNAHDRPKFLGFVGVQTGFGSADRRQALRSTWFPSDPEGLLRLEQDTGLAFRFVIGRSKNAKRNTELSEEAAKYKDFMLIDVEDEYAKLPYKTLAFFKAAYQLFHADYYVKVDDDIYLRPDRLATLLAKVRTNPMTYIGCMKKGPVITNPRLKWYESQRHLIGNEYFLHGYGPIYVLSAEVVASLAKARTNSLRMFSNEDVTIGSWMLAMNVQHEDNRAICQTKCTPTSIAVWDLPKCSGLCNPVTRLKELHQISMCSKSPTLPSDEE